MSEIVIRVENLSKQYRLGNVGLGSLSHDVNRWWHTVRGRENPYIKIGEENDRATKSASDYVWALRDINFDVQHGEVLGIIGKNGAGKSTLLKILSRTTIPTTGTVKIKGRVASLLEVGTGFHPELTGRENIFLNGAILGMTRREIKLRFDEIVDFAGVERYIDTPVKRYSSGMYVRLAFAVAAYLEPEILIVDEVLAVGDAEFQKKAIGKMKDVSRQAGRTVLFVSHNMTAIKSLCTKSIWMANGSVKDMGDTAVIVEKYFDSGNSSSFPKEIDYSSNENFHNEFIKLLKIKIESASEFIKVTDAFSIYFEFENLLPNADLNVSIVLYNKEEVCVFNSVSASINIDKGRTFARCYIPANYLNDEVYSVRLLVVKDKSAGLIDLNNVINLNIIDKEREGSWYGKWMGVVRPELKWEFTSMS